MNKIYQTIFDKNTGQYIVVSELAKGHKKSKSLTPILASTIMSMLLPSVAFATTYPDTLTGNATDGSTYDSIKSNPNANATLYTLATGDNINVVDDQSATTSNAEANAIKLNAAFNHTTIISGKNLTIGAAAKIGLNTNSSGNYQTATANALNIDYGTPSQTIEFLDSVTLSSQASYDSFNYSALSGAPIEAFLQLNASGIEDVFGHTTITFQGQAEITTQAQGNNLTVSADSDIYIATNLSATGINYANFSSNGILTFEQNALINTTVKDASQHLSTTSDTTTQLSSYNSLNATGVYANDLYFLGDQTKIITEVLSEDLDIHNINSGAGSQVNNLSWSRSNSVQGLSGSGLDFESNAAIETRTTTGHIDVSSAAEQIQSINSSLNMNAVGVSVNGLNLNGDQTKIITEVVSGDITINTSNSEANSVVSGLYGVVANYVQGLSGSGLNFEGNVAIETRETTGLIDIAIAAAQIGSIENNTYNNITGVSAEGEFKGDQTSIITESVSGNIAINTSNSGANSVVNALYSLMNNSIQSLSASNLDFEGNAAIETRATTGRFDLTSEAVQIGSIQASRSNYIYGVNASGLNVKGAQTKIITENTSGDIAINTSNSDAASLAGTVYGGVNNVVQGLSGDNIDIEGNADIQTRSTAGSIAITSAAKQVQGIYGSVYHETYGVSAWGRMNFQGGQIKIMSNTFFGGLSIKANNSTQLNEVFASMQSFTSGLSGSGTGVHFQGNAGIVATNRSGNIVIEAPLAHGSLDDYVAINLYATGVQNITATFDKSVDITAQAQAGNISINAPSLTISTAPNILAQAEGLLANNPSFTTSVVGDTKILATASSGFLNMNGSISNGHATAYGVHALNDTKVELQGNVNISTIANAHKDSSVAAGEEKAYALFAENLGAININQAGDKNVQLIGDLVTENNGLINIKMNSTASFLRGLVSNQSGEIKLSLGNGATWQPTSNGDAMGNISSTFGSSSPLDLQASGIIDLAWWNNQNDLLNPSNRYRTLNIDNMVFNDGGGFRVNTDIEHNRADKVIVTNASGSGTQHIQVAYDTAMASMTGDHIILSAATLIPVLEVPIGTPINMVIGDISSIDSGLYRWTAKPEIIWDSVTGVASIGQLDIRRTRNLSETPLTVADAHTSLVNHWQLESSNMLRRVGDLRLSADTQNGAWARTYSGSLKSDSSYDRHFNQKFSGIQTGYDQQFEVNAGKMYAGLMFNYLQSDPSYVRGNGELNSYGLGAYGSWISDAGHYVDVVLRTSRLSNEYSLVDKSEQTVSGNYHTWAYGMSAEYGYRAQLEKQWFVEPQVELTLGRIDGSTHTTNNGFHIDQAAENMTSSRVGVLLGKTFGEDTASGNAYVRASWLHDFNKKGDVSTMYLNQSIKLDTLDRRGNALEVNVGTNVKLAKKWDAYAELSKTWGNVVETDWQVNAGVRLNW